MPNQANHSPQTHEPVNNPFNLISKHDYSQNFTIPRPKARIKSLSHAVHPTFQTTGKNKWEQLPAFLIEKMRLSMVKTTFLIHCVGKEGRIRKVTLPYSTCISGCEQALNLSLFGTEVLRKAQVCFYLIRSIPYCVCFALAAIPKVRNITLLKWDSYLSISSLVSHV